MLLMRLSVAAGLRRVRSPGRGCANVGFWGPGPRNSDRTHSPMQMPPRGKTRRPCRSHREQPGRLAALHSPSSE